jgi:AcrR family transcriptional regulator
MSTALSLPAVPATRERILDGTERLLGRLGYQKTTMDDLAREAGVSKRTLYFYFASKEEIALASIDRIVERLCARLQEIAAGAGDPVTRLRAMLLTRVLFRFDSVRDYYHTLDGLFASLRPAYLKRREAYLATEAKIFARAVQDGIDQGCFARRDASEVAQAMLVATNGLLPYGLTTRELGKRSAIEKRAAIVADLLLQGLRRQV